MANPAPILNRVGARPIPREYLGASDDELFRLGFDTFDIAARLRISEPEALELVTSLRRERLGYSGYRGARMSA